jgi:hypothetical protein
MSRRRPPPRGRALVITALFGVLCAALVVVLVLQLARSPEVKVQLGDEVFEAGRAKDLVDDVDRHPLLFQALVGNRDIYLQHTGDDPKTGWIAFEAYAPGAPRRCQLRWERSGRVFRDPCDDKTYPSDGAGLTRYSATVNDNERVVIDLRRTLDG